MKTSTTKLKRYYQKLGRLAHEAGEQARDAKMAFEDLERQRKEVLAELEKAIAIEGTP